MSLLKVMLVDDHVLVREGLRQLLLTFKNIDVVCEAGDGEEAIIKAGEIKPDIVILDISMPKSSGIQVIREIKKVTPETQILVLSMHADEQYVRESLKRGASGYILKQSAPDELRAALQFIADGQIYLSPAISKSVVKDWLSQKAKREDGTEKSERLSIREREIVGLLTDGYSNKEIAERLFISVKTVETHRHRIMTKLNLKSLAALVKYAMHVGIDNYEK
jgi:two-component system, NarL family, response regulator NreC